MHIKTLPINHDMKLCLFIMLQRERYQNKYAEDDSINMLNFDWYMSVNNYYQDLECGMGQCGLKYLTV